MFRGKIAPDAREGTYKRAIFRSIDYMGRPLKMP